MIEADLGGSLQARWLNIHKLSPGGCGNLGIRLSGDMNTVILLLVLYRLKRA